MARGKKKEKELTPEEKLQLALVPIDEQPYEVPENWCWTKIKALCTLKNGKAFKPTDWSEDGLPIVRIQNLNNQDLAYNHYNGLAEEDYRLYGGELLFAWSGTPGTSFGAHIWWGKDAVLNQHIFRVDIDERCINKRFFMNAINQRLDMLISAAHGGAGLQHVTKGVFENTAIVFPPLPEQQRIINRIESLFVKLDEAKEKAQAVVDGFEDRKAAILYKAFTGELTENWRSANNYSKAEWVHKKFSEICDIVRGGSPRPAGDPKYYDGSIPFLKVADITNNNGPYVTYATYSIKEAGLRKTRMVEANTLLLTNSGATLGVPAICTFQTTFNDGIAAFLNLDPESTLFYYYFWVSKTKELRTINMGAAQPNLNTNIIGAIEIDIPATEEQKEIVRVLKSILKKEKMIKEAAEHVIDQIDLMKKSILSRAFRGELGTNDPTDESAEKLLERMLI